MMKQLCALGALVLLAACSGGGGGASGSSSSGMTPSGGGGSSTSNFVTLTVDGGPASVAQSQTPDTNEAFVSVTLCAPGSATNCQTIDHVLVDTGSVGLRIFASVLNANLMNAMPLETDTSGNPVGECLTFVDGYAFGSVRQANFQVGGESVSGLPLQVIADSGVFSNPPSSCTAGGGTNLNTVQLFGANGVIGIGVTSTDCGPDCNVNGSVNGPAIYYDCPSGGCSSIIARAASVKAPFQQVPNPVAALPVDNNGTIISLPSVPAAGEASVSGTLFFGIGTESNNGLGSAKIFTTSTFGNLTVNFNGQSLSNSFVDSGSDFYFFVDSGIPACTQTGFTGFYCPASPTALSPTVQGANGATGSAAFTLQNAQTVLVANVAAAPGIGANPSNVSGFNAPSNSFDLGLPSFYGHPVFTAIGGFAAAGVAGPWVGF
jgi:hypothetical protein